jgi:hypothetical protein
LFQETGTSFAYSKAMPIFFSSLLPKACSLLGLFFQLALVALVLTYCSIFQIGHNNAKAVPSYEFMSNTLVAMLALARFVPMLG